MRFIQLWTKLLITLVGSPAYLMRFLVRIAILALVVYFLIYFAIQPFRTQLGSFWSEIVAWSFFFALIVLPFPLVYLSTFRNSDPLGLFGNDESHGSAHFLDPKLINKYMTIDGSELNDPQKILVGREIRKPNKLIHYSGDGHLLTLAPTRSGKGVGVIIPNLLLKSRSCFVIDPKGENAQITANQRNRYGRVCVLDPFEVSGSKASHYNPMDLVDKNSIDVAEDATTLAGALVYDPPDQTKEAHWNEEAKALIAGIVLFVAFYEEGDRRTLGTVRELLTLAPDKFTELLNLMQESTEANGLIARAANRHLGKADREAASVLSNTQRHTHFLDSPRMQKTMQSSDFKFNDLKHEVMTVFVCLPPDRLDDYARWLRLLVTQAIMSMARDLKKPTSPVLFLLDEFAALGHLPAVDKAMGLMAGYGMQIWPILQDMSQLKALYGEKANSFIANAGVLQVFNVNDLDTAEWLSKMMGEATVKFHTTSVSDGGNMKTNYSSATNTTSRNLLNPDEILTLPPNTLLMKQQGYQTAILKKIRYYEDTEFNGLFSAPLS